MPNDFSITNIGKMDLRLRRMQDTMRFPESQEEMKQEINNLWLVHEDIPKGTYETILDVVPPVFEDYWNIIKNPENLDNAAFDRLQTMYKKLGISIYEKWEKETYSNYRTMVEYAYCYIKSINCVIPDYKDCLSDLKRYYEEVFKPCWLNLNALGLGIISVDSKTYPFQESWNGTDNKPGYKDIQIENEQVGSVRNLGFDKLYDLYIQVDKDDEFVSTKQMKQAFDILKNQIMKPLCMTVAMSEIDEHTMSGRLFIYKMDEVYTFLKYIQDKSHNPTDKKYDKLGFDELSELYGRFRVAVNLDYCQYDPTVEKRAEERKKEIEENEEISANYVPEGDENLKEWNALSEEFDINVNGSLIPLKKHWPMQIAVKAVLNTAYRLKTKQKFVNDNDLNDSFRELYNQVLVPLHMTGGMTIEEIFPEKTPKAYMDKVMEVFDFLKEIHKRGNQDKKYEYDRPELYSHYLWSAYNLYQRTKNTYGDRARKPLPVIPKDYRKELNKLEESMKVWNSGKKNYSYNFFLDPETLKLALEVNQRISKNGFVDADDMTQCFDFLYQEILLPLKIAHFDEVEQFPKELMSKQVYMEKMSEVWGILQLMQKENGAKVVNGEEVEATPITNVMPFMEKFEVTHNIPYHDGDGEFLKKAEQEQKALEEKAELNRAERARKAEEERKLRAEEERKRQEEEARHREAEEHERRRLEKEAEEARKKAEEERARIEAEKEVIRQKEEAERQRQQEKIRQQEKYKLNRQRLREEFLKYITDFTIPYKFEDQKKQLNDMLEVFGNENENKENHAESIITLKTALPQLVFDYGFILSYDTIPNDMLMHLNQVREVFGQKKVERIEYPWEALKNIQKVWALTKGYTSTLTRKNKLDYYNSWSGENGKLLYGRVEYAKHVFDEVDISQVIEKSLESHLELERQKQNQEKTEKERKIDDCIAGLKGDLRKNLGAYRIPDDPTEQLQQFEQMMKNFKSDKENTYPVKVCMEFNKNMKLLLEDYNKLIYGEEAQDVVAHLNSVYGTVYGRPKVEKVENPIEAILEVWTLTKGYTNSISGKEKPRYYSDWTNYGRERYDKLVFADKQVQATIKDWANEKLQKLDEMKRKEAEEKKAAKEEKEKRAALEKVNEKTRENKKKEVDSHIEDLRKEANDSDTKKILDFVSDMQKFLVDVDKQVNDRCQQLFDEIRESKKKMEELDKLNRLNKLDIEKGKLRMAEIRDTSIKINSVQSYIMERIKELKARDQEFMNQLDKSKLDLLTTNQKEAFTKCRIDITNKIDSLKENSYATVVRQKKIMQKNKLGDSITGFMTVAAIDMGSRSKHQGVFNSITAAIKKYDTGLDTVDNLADLYRCCREYLNIHTNDGASNSIGGQNTLNGRLRKQVVVKLLETMHNEEEIQPEFKMAREKYEGYYEFVMQRKCPTLNLGLLKESLANKSKAPVEKRGLSKSKYIDKQAYEELRIRKNEFLKDNSIKKQEPERKSVKIK